MKRGPETSLDREDDEKRARTAEEEGVALILTLPNEMTYQILGYLRGSDLVQLLPAHWALVAACTRMGMERQQKVIKRLAIGFGRWDGCRPLVSMLEVQRMHPNVVPFTFPWYSKHLADGALRALFDQLEMFAAIPIVDANLADLVAHPEALRLWPLVEAAVAAEGIDTIMAWLVWVIFSKYHTNEALTDPAEQQEQEQRRQRYTARRKYLMGLLFVLIGERHHGVPGSALFWSIMGFTEECVFVQNMCGFWFGGGYIVDSAKARILQRMAHVFQGQPIPEGLSSRLYGIVEMFQRAVRRSSELAQVNFILDAYYAAFSASIRQDPHVYRIGGDWPLVVSMITDLSKD